MITQIKRLPLSKEDKSHLSSINGEISSLRDERVEFLKSKGYKLLKVEDVKYWVHISVWDTDNYVIDLDRIKYLDDSVLEY
jgi:hypothetical protein